VEIMELWKLAEQYRYFFDSMTNPILVIDPEGNNIDCNEAAQKFLESTYDELMEKNIREFFPPGKEDEMLKEQKPIWSRGGEVETQYCINGKIKSVELLFEPKEWNSQQAVVIIGKDITERKEAEEKIKKYSKDLEESNQMKDLFSDIMHHDIMNPTGSIRGMVEILLEDAESTEKQLLLRIMNNIDRQIELIDNAKRLSKLGASDELEKEELDLKEVIETSLDLTKHRFNEAGMDIDNRITSSITIKTNPVIVDIFLNILSNCAKYASEGKKVILTIRKDKQNVVISVKDFGPGIPDEYKEGVFKRFKRREKKGVKGTGLGMAIAKKIVDLHEGKIWIENNLEGGSVFKVRLPRK